MSLSSSHASAVFRRSSFSGRTDKYMPSLMPSVVLSESLEKALSGVAPADVSGSLMTDPYVQDAVTRLGRYREALDYYAGRNLPDFENGVRVPKINFARKVVNKRAAWVAGRGFRLMPRRGNEDVVEILNAVWAANGGKRLIRRSAKVALTTGDSFLYFTVISKNRAGVPLPKEKWTIRICPINPSFVFPIWCEDDPARMKAVMLQFPVWGKNARDNRVFSAVYTEDTVEFYDNQTKVSSGPNPLGVIPLVHVANDAYGDMPFGISILEDLKNPIQKYSESLKQIGKIIQYHSEPTTIVYGTSLSNMERGSNRVWSNLPPPNEARVENLEMRGDLGASYKILEIFKDEIYELGRTPQISFDSKGLAVSNTSGVAMQMLYQPLIEATEESWDDFGLGISVGNEIIAAITKNVLGVDLAQLADEPDNYLTVETRWESLLPRDAQQELDQLEKKLNMGVISRAEVARRVSGITDTERLALELAADGAAVLALDAQKARALQGQMPNFTAAMLGSVFLAENFLDLITQVGDLTRDDGNGSSSDSDAGD